MQENVNSASGKPDDSYIEGLVADVAPPDVAPASPIRAAGSAQRVPLEGDAADPSPVHPAAQAPSKRPGPSFAELWEASHQKPAVDLRLLVALGASALMMLAVVGAVYCMTPKDVDRWNIAHVMAHQSEVQEDTETDWFADLLSAAKRPSPWEPVQSPPPGSSERPTTSTSEAVTKKRPPKVARASTRPVREAAASAAAAAEPADDYDPLYAQYYGSGSRVAAASARAASIAAVAAKKGSATVNVRGVEVVAQLLDTAASDVANAPLKARTREAVRLGGVQLPQGTDIEGIVSGGKNSRVYAIFSLARLANGQTVVIEAIARDLQGGLGIPGRKEITSKTAGAVGVAALGRAIAQGGRLLGGAMGEIAGAGVEGAADATSQKSNRLDRDEERVVADAGLRFKLYFTGAEPQRSAG